MTLSEFLKGNGFQFKCFIFFAIIAFLVSLFSEIFINADTTVSEQLVNLTLTNSALKFYVGNFHLIWYSMLLFFILAFWKPYKKSFDIPNTLTIQLTIAASLVFGFLILSLTILSRLPEANDGSYTVLIGVFSVFSVAIGWLINAQLSRKHQKQNEEMAKHNHKRSHTLNIILQQRLSEEYHKNVANVADAYPLNTGEIPEDDIKAYMSRHDEDATPVNDLNIKAIRSTLFLLDLYEFVCEGIKQGDLDEKVVYESIGGTILRNVDRSALLINAIRVGKYGKEIPKAFKTLLDYVKDWKDKHASEEAKILLELKK